jgi:hypothetical protein
VKEGPLETLPRTFGMQLFAADFSAVESEGSYRVKVSLSVAGTTHALVTAPFEIRRQIFSRRMLQPLSLLNAEARDAADEDLRRNWRVLSGGFALAADSAIVAMDADDAAGALMERIADGYNHPLEAGDFSYQAEVTILSGCDAQLQFRINETSRYAVTLQVGDGCAHGSGPGAVRLHEEGTAVSGGFRVVAAQAFTSGAPLTVGVPHMFLVRVSSVSSGTIDVDVDGVRMLSAVPISSTLAHGGRFGLKAWGASVRFDHVQAWDPRVRFVGGAPRVEDPSSGDLLECERFALLPPSDARNEARHIACYPLFATRHGFHDCNNYIGEATSHGGFLAALMDVWDDLRDTAEKERVRAAILRTFAYLELLYRQAGSTGAFAHQEYGRGGIDGNLGYYQPLAALYGMAAFAARGAEVDPARARTACEHAIRSVAWLRSEEAQPARTYSGDVWSDDLKALVYLQLATCARREGLDVTAVFPSPAQLEDEALAAGERLIAWLAAPETLRTMSRDTGRMFPWLEGVYALRQAFPARTAHWPGLLAGVVAQLTPYIAAHNGFHVLPQASGST